MHGPTPSLREPPAPAVHASPTAGPSLVRAAAIAAAAAVFLAVAAPFGTGSAGFATRLGYWVLLLALGGGCGQAVAELFRRRGWLDGAPWRVIALITLVTTPPFTLIVWTLTGWVFEGRLRAAALPGFVVPVATVTAAVTSLNVLLRPRPAPAPSPDAVPQLQAPGAIAAPRLLDRLPPKLKGAELYAIESEDHYLRLHTSRGSDLILMRLADAMAELEGIEGAQTHRSWWVARDAVEGADRGDGRATLRLKGGVEAPVSRTYARALREGGWF